MTHELDAKGLDRDEALKWAEQWHRCAETICTMLGLSGSGSPEEILAEVSAYIGNAEPVAWLVKDYADGWIGVQQRETADWYRERGHGIRPLYLASPPSPSVEELVRALEGARAVLLRHGYCGAGDHGAGDPEINEIDAALSRVREAV